MDPQGPMGDQALTDDEKMKVGLQQAAILEMSRDAEFRERGIQQQLMIERQKEQDLMEAQQKALKMQQDQDRLEQLKLMQQQAQALQERQKEEEIKRMQEQALLERQQETETPSSGGGGPPRPHRDMQPPPLSGPPGFPMPGQQGPMHHRMPTPLQQQQQGPPPQAGSQGVGPSPSGPQGMSGQQQQQQRGPMPPPPMQRPPGGPPPPMQRPGGPPPPLQRPPVSMAGGPPPFSQNQPPRGVRPMMQPPPPGISMSQGGPSGDQQRDGPGGRDGGPFQHGGGPPGGEGGKRGMPPPLMSVETRPPTQRLDDDDEDDDNEGGVHQHQREGGQGSGGQDNEEEPSEFKLPQALEKILAFKEVRVQEVGVRPEEMEKIEKGELIQEEEPEAEGQGESVSMTIEDYGEEEDDDEPAETVSKSKESKNKKRKKKKKKAKQRKGFTPQMAAPTRRTESRFAEEEQVEVEYIPEEPMLDRTDPSYREFSKIFKAFKIEEPESAKDVAPKVELTTAQKVEGELGVKARAIKELGEEDQFEGSSNDEEEVDDKPKMSKKKMKKINRLSVAELKQLVTRPDVVEMHDVTARDPKLLINIKATRNTVPVPRHWCFKRKYLQGKRGIEKPPFDLPEFIKNTGIMEMRQALQEKEEAKNLKAKMREKVRPKMGKIDIDYQKLHDAFFKYQTKPKMSIHGDLYYEGKEFETRLKEKKPGNLTDDLRTALGMPLGANADKYPPPWLIAMQRYGPPPSYPNLKISGLNGPIPEGCAFGYHAGGWGKPPVDEHGKPLYGDVFGAGGLEAAVEVEEEEVERARWGELESESEEESESESESEEERDGAQESGLVTPGDPGLVTPSGVTSVPVGMETPDMIELRKKRIEDAMDQGGDTPALYQVIPEKKTSVGAAMMGSAHVYDMAVVAPPVPTRGADNAEGVEVVLNPDELDMDTAAMQAKYEQQVREQQSQLEKEDLSDMVADHAAKQAKKRKKQQQDTSKSAKKYKDFKF